MVKNSKLWGGGMPPFKSVDVFMTIWPRGYAWKNQEVYLTNGKSDLDLMNSIWRFINIYLKMEKDYMKISENFYNLRGIEC